MAVINMLSSAERVKGQGVGSAYHEQVSLVTEGLKEEYRVKINRACIADITHYHTIDLKFFLTIPFAKAVGKTVGYVHFLPETVDGSLKLPWPIKKAFYRYIISFYHSMDYLVTVNPYFIERLAAHGIDRNKITYIPNFVSDREFFPMDPDAREKVRERYGLSRGKFAVLGVGQVQTRKGVRDFIDTALAVPEAQFLWAGGFSFGRITDGYHELKELVENPPENVRFIGIVPREEMNGIYNASDALFMPSYNELFPMAILEALNCEKPILLRDLDIYKNILFDYYLKGDTNKEFADIIRGLIRDPLMYAVWKEKAKECGRFYSREHVLKMWKDFYDAVFQGPLAQPDRVRAMLARIIDMRHHLRKKKAS